MLSLNSCHRNAVKELYRLLIRHTIHLNQINSTFNHRPLLKLINFKFHSKKHLNEPKYIKQALEEGYKLENQLRQCYIQNKILELPQFIEKKPIIQPTEEGNQSNSSPLSFNSAIYGHYIHKLQKEGLLPKKISPQMRPLLYEEAKHYKSLKIIESQRKIISKPPFKVKTTKISCNFKVIRLPTPQPKKISNLIRFKILKDQKSLDLANQLPQWEQDAYYEYLWDKQMGQIDTDKQFNGHNQIIREYIFKKVAENKNLQANLERHSKTKLKSVIKYYQTKQNNHHEFLKQRFKTFKTDGTAFDDLLGEKTLTEQLIDAGLWK